MGCESCLTSKKAQQQELENVRKEAKEYAIESQKTMAIYREANDYHFIEAGEAISKCYPVIEFVSHHQ